MGPKKSELSVHYGLPQCKAKTPGKNGQGKNKQLSTQETPPTWYQPRRLSPGHLEDELGLELQAL